MTPGRYTSCGGRSAKSSTADAEPGDRAEPRNECKKQSRERVTHGEVLGESLKCTGIFKMLENVSSRVPPLNGVVAYCREVNPSSRQPGPRKGKIGNTDDHLVDQDTQRPPIHGRCVPMCVDHLGGDVFYRPGQFQCCVA